MLFIELNNADDDDDDAEFSISQSQPIDLNYWLKIFSMRTFWEFMSWYVKFQYKDKIFMRVLNKFFFLSAKEKF